VYSCARLLPYLREPCAVWCCYGDLERGASAPPREPQPATLLESPTGQRWTDRLQATPPLLGCVGPPRMPGIPRGLHPS